MDIITVSLIIAAAVLLMMGSCIVFIKLFGKGLFFGISIDAVTAIGEDDDPEAIIYNIIDSIGSEFEYSGSKLIIMDIGMDLKSVECCRRICERYDYIEMCTPDKLPEKICSLRSAEKKLL